MVICSMWGRRDLSRNILCVWDLGCSKEIIYDCTRHPQSRAEYLPFPVSSPLICEPQVLAHLEGLRQLLSLTLGKGPRECPSSLVCNQSWELQQPQVSCSSEWQLYPPASDSNKTWGQTSNALQGESTLLVFLSLDHSTGSLCRGRHQKIGSTGAIPRGDKKQWLPLLPFCPPVYLRHTCLILHLPLIGQEHFLITALHPHHHDTNAIIFKSTASLAEALNFYIMAFSATLTRQSRVILSLTPTCHRNRANNRGNATQLKCVLCFVWVVTGTAASPAHLKQGQQLLGVLFLSGVYF